MAASEHVLIILGGELPGEQVVRPLVARATWIVCADSGSEHARRLGLDVQAIVGDLDSITPETFAFYKTRGTEIIQRPDQNHDDFEKALEYVATAYSGSVAVLGMTGLRTDHLLANLSVMLRMTDRFEQLIAYDDFASYRFLTATRITCTIECPLGTLISLMPFGEACHVATTNLQYPLNSEDLSLAQRTGLSNVATGSSVSIRIGGGALLVSVGHMH